MIINEIRNLIFAGLLLLFSCSSNRPKTAYLRTGFYFLEDEKNGVKKRKDKTNEIFSIAKLPFASVDNIVKVEVERTFVKGERFTELCEYFDSTGTRAIKMGTGDSLHPKSSCSCCE